MNDPVLDALLQKGWTYDVISVKTGINVVKLKSNSLKPRELDELYRVAVVEAGIDIDGLEG